ncbi:MAG: hypothetical protein QXT65_04595 [Candidatus Nitrosocaldaceae archaeon]
MLEIIGYIIVLSIILAVSIYILINAYNFNTSQQNQTTNIELNNLASINVAFKNLALTKAVINDSIYQ